MARLRKFSAYRTLDRPYTRFSKYKQKSYVRSKPVCKIPRFEAGDRVNPFECQVHLVTKSALQIRDNALEAARQASNRYLEKTLTKTGYGLKFRVYPHHVLRENPLASGAGADRLSTGMKKSFGKAIGVAAQLRVGQPIITVRVKKEHIPVVREAFRRATSKLPCACKVVVEEPQVAVATGE